MSAVAVVIAVLLGAAATLTVVRLLRGPSTLDRVVATDLLLAVVTCGLATRAAVTLDSTVVPLLVVLSLLGFIGSVSVARLIGRRQS